MNATLVYDGPHALRVLGAVLSVPKFAYVFEARAWALQNGLAFLDARYKRVELREDGYTWQVVTKRSPRPILAQMAWEGYAGVTLDRLTEKERWEAYLRPLVIAAMRREFVRSAEGQAFLRRNGAR